MRAYNRGDKIRLSVVFTDITNTEVDPTEISCKVKKPSATNTTYVYGEDDDLIQDSQGNYHIDIEADIDGVWYYRWAGTGVVVAAAENAFTVLVSEVL